MLSVCRSFALLLSVVLFTFPSFAQEAPRTLGLYGCDVTSLASTSDGAYQFVGCGSVSKGFYYSTDFGANWIYGSGGDYASGAVWGLQKNSSMLYMLSSELMRAPLPSGTGAWTPAWESLGIGNIIDFRVNDTRIYVLFADDTVWTYDASTGASLASVASGADAFAIKSMALTPSALFMVASDILYKHEILADGTLGAAVEVAPLGAGWKVLNILNGPSNSIYVILHNTAGTEQRFLISPDSGTSYNLVPSTVLDHIYTSCYSGNTVIAGEFVSRDGGTSWVSYRYGNTASGTVYLWNGPCLVHPTDPNKVLVSINRGPVSTSDFLTNLDPFWTEASNKLEAVRVFQIAQDPLAKNNVVLKTQGGVASTATFLSESPTWNWSCGGDDVYCGFYAHVTADLVDSGVFYLSDSMSGKVKKGSMDSSSGVVTWTDLVGVYGMQNPSRITVSQEFPGMVIIPREEYVGGIYPSGSITFNSSSDGSLLKQVFDGHPVAKVVVASDNVLFAIVNKAPIETNMRGIYRSLDGGDNWTRMTDELVSAASTVVESFVYDSVTDTLWAALHRDISAGYEWHLVYLRNASTSSSEWIEAERPISGGNTLIPSAIATDPRENRVYIAGDGKIFATTDYGVTWLLLHSEPYTTTVYELLFDDLLEASDLGLREIPQTTCTLKIDKYRGRAIKLPRKFTFKVSYSGTYPSGKLQSRKSSTARWKDLSSIRFKRGKATLKKKIGRGMQLRALVSDCVTDVKTIKKAR